MQSTVIQHPCHRAKVSIPRPSPLATYNPQSGFAGWNEHDTMPFAYNVTSLDFQPAIHTSSITLDRTYKSRQGPSTTFATTGADGSYQFCSLFEERGNGNQADPSAAASSYVIRSYLPQDAPLTAGCYSRTGFDRPTSGRPDVDAAVSYIREKEASILEAQERRRKDVNYEQQLRDLLMASSFGGYYIYAKGYDWSEVCLP